MKKGDMTLLLVITAMFVAFTAGLLLGRHIRSDKVTIQAALTQPAASSPSDSEEDTQETLSPKDLVININTASFDELQTLPGVGRVLAQRIIDFRAENGPFKKCTDLITVDGIGEKLLSKILDMITVED